MNCRFHSFSDNYSNLIKIYPDAVVRWRLFISHPRNIAFELASSFGLSLKLITCWSCTHQPLFYTPVSFILLSFALFQPGCHPLRHFSETILRKVAYILRDWFRLEAHFLLGGILPISDCFVKRTTDISENEKVLFRRIFDSGEIRNLRMDNLALELSILRERERNHHHHHCLSRWYSQDVDYE